MKKISLFPSILASTFFAMVLMSCALNAQLPDFLTNGLVGEWHFSGSGDDASGRGNNVIISGATLFTDRFGNPNSALAITSNYGGAVTLSNINISGNETRTISYWTKFATLGSSWPNYTQSYIAWGDDSTVGSRFLWSQESKGNLWFNGNYADIYISPPNNLPNYNVWRLVTLTYNGTLGSAIVYVNGVVQTNRELGVYNAVDWSGTLNTVDTPVSMSGLAGDFIDDVTIYNRALSSTEVKQLHLAQVGSLDSDEDGSNDYREIADGTNPNDATSFNPLSKGLLAYYPFDGNASDDSGNDLHGTMPNGALAITNRFYEKTSAYYFNGVNQYVEYPRFGLTNARTFSGWVKFPEAAGEWSGVPYTGRPEVALIGQMSEVTTSLERWHFQLYGLEDINDPKSLAVFYHSVGFPDDNRPYAAYSSARNNGWHHYVAVVDPASTNALKVSIFLNGVEIGKVSSRVPPELSAPYQSMRVDGGPSGGQIYYFKGSLDDLRIYNRALSPNEVSALYYKEAFDNEQRSFIESNPSVAGNYSRAQYDANRTSGQTDVTTNPSAFNLFTQAQYDANYATGYGAGQSAGFSSGQAAGLSAGQTAGFTSGQAAGRSEVTGNPSAFSLFTQSQFDANRLLGRMDVTTNPASFGLFTKAQHDLSRTNGRTDVTSNPSAFGLFTKAQYDANRTNGQTDVTGSPATHGLFTREQYESFGDEQFALGTGAVLSALPAINIAAPAAAFVRVGLGTSNITNVTAAELPAGWQFDPVNREIYGRLAGTDPVSALLLGKGSGEVDVPFAFNFSAQRPQKLALTVKASVKVGERFSLIATAGSQLPITITSSDPNVVRINQDGTATALSKGRVNLTATQAGDQNYAAAPAVTKKVTVR